MTSPARLWAVRLLIVTVAAGLVGAVVYWDVVSETVRSLLSRDAEEVTDPDLELPPLEHLEATGEIQPLVVQSVAIEDPDEPDTILFQYDTSTFEGERFVVSDALGIGHVGAFTTVVASGSAPLPWNPGTIERLDLSGTIVLLYHATDDPEVGVNVYRIILSEPLLP